MNLFSFKKLNWKIIFRLLLCLFVSFEIIGFIIPDASQGLLSLISKDDLRRIPRAVYNIISRMSLGIICFGAAAFIIQITALVGLWKFWRSARELFIVSYILSTIFIQTTQTIVVYYWWTLPMNIIYNIVVVAIIVFSYTRCTNEYFNRNESVDSKTIN